MVSGRRGGGGSVNLIFSFVDPRHPPSPQNVIVFIMDWKKRLIINSKVYLSKFRGINIGVYIFLVEELIYILSENNKIGQTNKKQIII